MSDELDWDEHYRALPARDLLLTFVSAYGRDTRTVTEPMASAVRERVVELEEMARE